MKALTIIQPWATLIASGHKMNEPKQPAQPQINPMAALFGAMMQQAAQNQQEEGSEIESDDDE